MRAAMHLRLVLPLLVMNNTPSQRSRGGRSSQAMVPTRDEEVRRRKEAEAMVLTLI
ncbi:BnaC09g00170D [Brassica napus]|uniref:BnaC09g00170D protein n=1 Tax=Brassica napus TaxID=3708 RepID=A0A078G939_BRANA|nr:BnaC09g00170D [Brassica napus]